MSSRDFDWYPIYVLTTSQIKLIWTRGIYLKPHLLLDVFNFSYFEPLSENLGSTTICYGKVSFLICYTLTFYRIYGGEGEKKMDCFSLRCCVSFWYKWNVCCCCNWHHSSFRFFLHLILPFYACLLIEGEFCSNH